MYRFSVADSAEIIRKQIGVYAFLCPSGRVGSVTKIAIRVCRHLAFLETGSDMSVVCFADSSMIMHEVPESAEVSSCGLQNISRGAVQCVSARVTDAP